MPTTILRSTNSEGFVTTHVAVISRVPEFVVKLYNTLESNLDAMSLYMEADYKRAFPNGSGTPSSPGGIPYVQSGHLRLTVTWDRPAKLTRRIGSSLKPSGGYPSYARLLEDGTYKMRPRPWLGPGLDRNRKPIERIIGRPIR